MFQVWGNALTDSFQVLWMRVASVVPDVIVAVIIFVVGWIVGAFVGRIVESAFKALKVDTMLRNAGVDEVTSRAGIRLNSGAFIGRLVEWFIMLAFLIASFDVLHLTEVTASLKYIVLEKLPQVIIAVLILMVAVVVADLVKGVVVASLRAAGIHSANFIGAAAKWVIWIFAIVIALSQVGIADELLLTLFQGVIIALSLGLGLAFGLGGQEAAGEYIDKVRDEVRSHHEK